VKSFLGTVDTLIKKGIDPCQVDSRGRSLIHLAVTFAIPDGIRTLIDHGVSVNIRHTSSGLTPLQLAATVLDAESIRALLSKGAAPNLFDLKGRRVAEAILEDFRPDSDRSEIMPVPSDVMTESDSEFTFRKVEKGIQEVGDWVIKVLPCLLEVLKYGGRFDPKYLKESVNPWMRNSLRSAISDGQSIWMQKSEPSFFQRFVTSKELNGKRFFKTEKEWAKDSSSSDCQMCQETFSIKTRRHHCRACGLLCCDKCSTKQLQLFSPRANTVREARLSFRGLGASSVAEDVKTRVCDLCFNFLVGESMTPSLEKVKIKQFRQTTADLVKHLNKVIESLDSILDTTPSNESSTPLTSAVACLVGADADDLALSDIVDNWDADSIDTSIQNLRNADRILARYSDSSLEYTRLAGKIKENLDLFRSCG
jgi:hypothetical protein